MHSYLGSLGLTLGVGILLLTFMETNGGLPFNMPRSWFVNRSFWYFFGIVSFLAGCMLLRQTSYQETEWEADEDYQRFERLILYTRDGCHLCDEAFEILQRYERYLPAIEIVDIDKDHFLVEKFTECVPVVEIDDKIRFRGRVNEILLRRLINGTPLGSEAAAVHEGR